MFAVLGPLLLVLAAIGIYAVVAYAVSLRTTEIGVRLALGATPRRVVAQFVGENLSRRSASARWPAGPSRWAPSSSTAARSTWRCSSACRRCCWPWPRLRVGSQPAARPAAIRWPRCGSSRGVVVSRWRRRSQRRRFTTKARSARRRTKAVTLRLPAPREARLGDDELHRSQARLLRLSCLRLCSSAPPGAGHGRRAGSSSPTIHCRRKS